MQTAPAMAATSSALLPVFEAAASAAGAAIMKVYAAGGASWTKEDGSPLTEADLASSEVILARLAEGAPGIPVVSEESALPAPAPSFILVDPLDGTKEFLKRNGEFTVNIALVAEGRPICGVVYAPALGRLWSGAVEGAAELVELAPGADPATAPRRTIRVRPRPASGLTAVASRSHADADTEAFLSRLGVTDRRAAGSALKFCLVAEGEADVYPRFAPTMEWDTAAGHAVLIAAGGRVEAPDGSPFMYGKHEAGYLNGGFVAWGS